MNPAFLEAESAVVRAHDPRQGRPMLREELQEPARRAYAAREKKRKAKRATAASDTEANASLEKFVSRPGRRGNATAILAAVSHALACVGGAHRGVRAQTRTERARRGGRGGQRTYGGGC